MNVRVRSVGVIKMLLGEAELDVSLPGEATVGALLEELVAQKGEKFARFAVGSSKADRHLPLRIVVNGRDVAAIQGIHTILQEGDEVMLFFPLAGG